MSKYKPLSRKDFLNKHSKPVTRRQFLGLGLMQGTGYILMPSIFDLLFRATRAEAAGPFMPFMVFDGAGGFGLPTIFKPGGAMGPNATPLTNYAPLGFNTANVDTGLTSNAVPIQATTFLNGSGTNRGLLPVLQANGVNLGALQFMTICHSAQDDGTANPHSAIVSISSIYAAQAQLLNTGLGQSRTPSGGNSSVSNPKPSLNPLQVASVNSLLNAVGLSGSLSSLTKPQQTAWANLVASLTSIEANKFPQGSDAATLGDLSKAGSQKNLTFVNGAGAVVDPRNQVSAQQVYGIMPTTVGNDRQVIKATIAWNVLNGYTGPGVTVFGGCDYHDNNPATKNTKDAEIGQAIGEAIALASKLNKPFMFQIITDGGVNVSGTGVNAAATGDSGSKSMTVIGLFDPAVKDHYLSGRNSQNPQIGAYNMNGAGAVNSLVSTGGVASPVVAAAVVANYLNVLGRLGEFSQYTPVLGVDPQKLLVFG